MRLDENLQEMHTTRGMKAHKAFLTELLEESEEDFRRILFEARDEDKRLYLKIMLELNKLMMPRQQDVNVNLGVSQDLMELKALAQTGTVSRQEIAGFVDATPIHDIDELKEEDFKYEE